MKKKPLHAIARGAGRTRKALGTGITGVYVWTGLVIASPAAAISATEWYVLFGVGVSVAAVYGLTNDAAPVALPTAVAASGHGSAEDGTAAQDAGAPPRVDA